ncbi:uncharacterized protein ACNS7B_012259 isoform 1-T1 [Menidia menidia]
MDNHQVNAVLNEIVNAVSDLENIQQNVHISDYFRPLLNALQNAHMPLSSDSEGEPEEDATSNALFTLEQALHSLNNPSSPQSVSNQGQQHGGHVTHEPAESLDQNQSGPPPPPSGNTPAQVSTPSSPRLPPPSVISPAQVSTAPSPLLPPPSVISPVQLSSPGGGGHEAQSSSRQRRTFNVTEIRRPFIVTAHCPGHVPDLAVFYTSVMHVLMELADSAREMAARGDVVQLELVGEGFSRHVIVPVGGEDDVSIMHAFTGFLDDLVQSNAELPANNLELILQVVRNPSGGVKRKVGKTLDCELINKKRRHLYVVNNDENRLCFSISLAHVNNPCLTDREAALQGKQWQLMAGLTAQTPVNFSDVNKFERIVKRKIVVFYRKDGVLCKFETDFADRSNPLFLLLLGNHYYGIKNLTGFTGAKYTCKHCFMGFDHLERHFCDGFCPICYDPNCHLRPPKSMKCTDCNRICHDSICFDKHREPRLRPQLEKFRSNCETNKLCPLCKKLYQVPASRERFVHECSVKCTVCGEKLPGKADVTLNEHPCYIQPTLPDDGLDDKLVFYDFESFSNQDGVHVPFLVCTKTLKGVVWYAYGLDCVRQFVLQFRRPRYKGYTFIAHNARGYDSYLILSTMVKMGITPSLITQGSKILCFTDPDFSLKFIDSLSFLTMKLSAMPKALGFHDQSKGFFPHLFSSEQNLNYSGPFPPPSCYAAELMDPAERQRFDTWYSEVSKGSFDFQKEALHYCKNDVEILYNGCLKFREEFFKETHVNPFKCITIASACMKVFTSNFLPVKSLAIPSPVDYRRQCKTFSSASIQWLEWRALDGGIDIQHALNRGERKIGPYFVDGYAEVNGVKTAFEFYGCLFHGCPRCFMPNHTCPLRGVSFEALHTATIERERALQFVYGLDLQIMWEHEWVEMKTSDSGVMRFLQSFKPPTPLSPREALYGGRTCALKLRHTAREGESIYYVDFTSLYPYVNCSFPYPLGHPKIIYKDFDDPRNYYGFIRATVYPPRGLYFPVLPYKTPAGKLVFTLCRACADINNQEGSCSHSDQERALTGVWVSVEFKKALDLGYALAEITEVWHFEKQSGTIFKGYIHTFLKGKQEASGYPADAWDEESRLKYVEDYRVNQGIRLDPDKIEVNPAKRQVAKLCLNSFWGKFAQRSDLAQTTIVSQPDEFFNFLFSGKYTITYFHFLNDEMCMIQWKYNRRCISPPNKVNNVFIAAFTTAYARLKLYSCLERVREKVLYIDTDSLIYVVKEGDAPLELGNYLGDLTDELGGDTIKEFVAAGPKSYAYQTRDRKKVVMRVKGITQTHECSERVNFDSVKDLVEGFLQGARGGVIEAPQRTIRRDKKRFRLQNATFLKKFRVVYDKRRLFADGTTLPFGY